MPLSLRTVAGTVEEILVDKRGWIATGTHASQRTDGPSDLRVVVTTPTTTVLMCAPLGTGGRLSCRSGNLVVLNAWRCVNCLCQLRSAPA